MMRRLMMLVLAVAMIVPAGQAFAANSERSISVSFAPIHYLVDGVDYAPPAGQLGFINNENDSIYVPLRFVGTILNKKVKWDAASSTVNLGIPRSTDDLKEIQAYLSANKALNEIATVDKSKILPKSITISMREISYEFDGESIAPEPSTPGFIYEGSTYVPLRFVYVSLGYNPGWDSNTYTVTTVTPAYMPTKDSIVNKIASCTAEGISKGLKYINTDKMTPEEIEAGIQDVSTMISDCRTELELLLDTLTEQLEFAKQPTDIVTKFRGEMDSLEKRAKDFIDKNRK